jgi:hypothetical protein
MDLSSSSQNRQSRRSPVLLTATLDVGGTPVTVTLRNLSATGALVEGKRLPLEGSNTVFERKDLRVPAKVVWVHECFAGVAFARELEREEVLRSVPAPRPRPELDFRRPGLASRPLTDSERKMLERWMTRSPVSGMD